jgi:putative spermidine/putrescine transport system substrate-binding protein
MIPAAAVGGHIPFPVAADLLRQFGAFGKCRVPRSGASRAARAPRRRGGEPRSKRRVSCANAVHAHARYETDGKGGRHVKKILFVASLALVAALAAGEAGAQNKISVSSWGGSWKDMVADTIGKKFTAETGAQVEYVTGGTIDRLNKTKLEKGNPETDLVLTTSHVGWLYVSDDLFERLDLSRVPNAAKMFPEAKISPYHVGLWSYVYTIGYRPDLVPAGIKFESWKDLWDPRLKGMVGLPDFDPSHIITAAAMLSGGDAKTWQKGQKMLMDLKPNIKAYYSSDATSQEKIANGETPVQVLLSGNAFHMMSQGVKINLVIPKEGAIVGIDTLAINKGTKKLDLAYKFINAALDPEVQGQIIQIKKMGPMNSDTKVPADIAKLPGVFTTAQQWKEQAIVIDHKLRSEMMGDWRIWFTENIIAK